MIYFFPLSVSEGIFMYEEGGNVQLCVHGCNRAFMEPAQRLISERWLETHCL